ncbi:aminotransferase class V-fold PLP-dependent enzyme [Photobacterium chitinilyticum]|uniref:cysteine desulfurase n=1 Tax=Photobacterium chitinilyticum TaxID=2485123 RepID=A0A444JNH2_9GAMM|nr:aminotransferase class V-fold PLP-dependent enzyme [Photobacterium chitinilyticum]RWX54633.1 aminotransferase class V-fold PLP-dependent enzyme [Photobacterium chitinilyticum]
MSRHGISIAQVKSDFPLLKQHVNEKPLVYLDSAASAQKPLEVIERINDFYQNEYASVHRGVHHLSAEATSNMETVRQQVCQFIGASQREEIVFTSGTTEAINLVANSYGRINFKSGDEIIVSEMDHHANIVPWQMLAEAMQLNIKVWPVSDNGELSLDSLVCLLSERTVLVAVCHVSNVLGTVNPIRAIADIIDRHNTALERGASSGDSGVSNRARVRFLVDGAQAVMHQKVDVKQLGCDFYAFSGHKVYGPTGTGVLYAKHDLLQNMQPWQGGGSMIQSVDLYKGTEFNAAPWLFEAGTPNITGIMGLGAALRYLKRVGFEQISVHENKLTQMVLEALRNIPEVCIYGHAESRVGVIAFNLGKHHAFDVGAFLDRYGIAIRTGHHCAMPLMQRYGVKAMCRVSLAMYNTSDDIAKLVHALRHIQKLLQNA